MFGVFRSGLTWGVGAVTGVASEGWARVLEATAFVSQAGRAVVNGLRNGAERLQEVNAWMAMTIDSFPPGAQIPLKMGGRVLMWIIGFLKSSAFLWITLYMSIIIWIYLAMSMYPLLALEGAPDVFMDLLDALVDITRALWNILAGVWNFVVDVGTPFIPLYNLLMEFMYRGITMMISIFGEMIGSVVTAITKSTTLSSPLLQAHLRAKDAGFDMGWYLNFMVPIMTTACRIAWIVMDIAFMVGEVYVKYMLKIIVTLIGFIVRLLKLMACCQVDTMCCIREFIQLICEMILQNYINKWIMMSHLVCIPMVNVCPFKIIPIIPPPPIACSAKELANKKIECNCLTSFINAKPCKPCVFKCVETGKTMNWVKECPSSPSLRIEVIEQGWCSADPPEGKGAKPRHKHRGGTRSAHLHEHHLDIVEEDCYHTCYKDMRYRRCRDEGLVFRNQTYGRCDGEYIRRRGIPHRHSHPHATFNTQWDTTEQRIRTQGGDDDCRQWFRAYNDTTILSRDARDIMHYDMCILKYAWESPQQHDVINRHVKTFASTVRDWTDPFDDIQNPRLQQSAQAVHDLVKTFGYHFHKALRNHVREYRPGHEQQTRAHDLVSRLNHERLHQSWTTFWTRMDTVHRGTLYDKVFTQMDNHWETVRAAHLERTTRSSVLRSVRIKPRVSVSTRGLFLTNQDSCECHTETFSDGMERSICEVRCSNRKCAIDVYHCEVEKNPGVFSIVWTFIQKVIIALSKGDVGILWDMVTYCWKDRPTSRNPFGYAKTMDAFNGAGGRNPDHFTYCFPQIPPTWDLHLPEMTFDLWTFVLSLCNDVPDGACLCAEYDIDNLFEYDARWFWVFPYYIKARVQNAFVSTQFILTYYITEGTWVDRGWKGFFDLVFPHHFDSSVRNLWGHHASHASVGWLCAFLHLGSLLYVMFWGYFAYMMYVTFFAWLKMIVTDCLSFVTTFGQMAVARCWSPQKIKVEQDLPPTIESPLRLNQAKYRPGLKSLTYRKSTTCSTKCGVVREPTR
jgi:hypothetical protein